MKKLATTLLCMLACSAVYSLPVGNPSESTIYTEGLWGIGSDCDLCDPCSFWFDVWDIRIGYYGDFVFNRNLEVSGNGTGRGHAIRETEINTNAAYLVLNLCDFVDVFGTLGESKLRLQTSEVSWTPDNSFDSIFLTDSGFSWSIGLRAGLFSWKCFTVGLEGQYLSAHPEVTKFIDGEFKLFSYFNRDNKVTFSEWQVGLGLSYAILTVSPDLAIIPYVATKWSHARFTSRLTFSRPHNGTLANFELFDLKSNKVWGFAAGVTFTMCDLIGITVEGRWGDEKALYVNGQFRI